MRPASRALVLLAVATLAWACSVGQGTGQVTGTVHLPDCGVAATDYTMNPNFFSADFVEDPRPVLLVPPGQSVDASVADLLSRVAPDRKKAGLNPADTGPFEGKAGQQPENFRWEIESARGYAPR